MSIVWAEDFTPNEAAALSELPEKQVRKEIEHHVLDVPSPPRLSFAALVYLRVFKLMDLHLSVDDRVRIYRRLLDVVRPSPRVDIVDVGAVVALRVGPIIDDLIAKVQRFERWKERIVVRPDVMGGEATFPNSRLTVRRVGSMLERGEPAQAILEDYPYLTPEDLELAHVYVRAYPRVGRPPAASDRLPSQP